MRELSRFQPVRRDFSLLFPSKVRWSEIDAALAAVAPPELIDWQAREVFHGAKQARAGESNSGEYSLLLGATFQAADRTLRDEELQAYTEKVVEAVSTLGGRLRS